MNRLLMGFVPALLAGFLLMAATSPELRVQVRAGKLSVHADGVPLSGVLWAISAQTGIQLNITGGMQSAGMLVTDDFTDLPLGQGIVRLLRKHLKQSGYAIITDEKTGALKSVHILAGAPGTSPSPVTSAPASPPVAADQPSPRATERGDPRDMADRGASDINQALDAVRAATHPEAQIRALLALGNFQDPSTLQVLQPALKSELAEVRQAALEAMRWGTVYDEVALADVRAVAASDQDPAVRQAALDVLVRYDETPEARALLEKLATEEGGAYREFARRELKRMDEEAEARSQPDPQVQR